jgi:hypothetical protein
MAFHALLTPPKLMRPTIAMMITADRENEPETGRA